MNNKNIYLPTIELWGNPIDLFHSLEPLMQYPYTKITFNIKVCVYLESWMLNLSNKFSALPLTEQVLLLSAERVSWWPSSQCHAPCSCSCTRGTWAPNCGAWRAGSTMTSPPSTITLTVSTFFGSFCLPRGSQGFINLCADLASDGVVAPHVRFRVTLHIICVEIMLLK